MRGSRSPIWLNEEAMKEEALKVRHEQWMKEYKRTYKNEAEKAQRFEVFKANVEFIEKFNAEQEEKYGPRENVIGTNGFADWTREEYLALLTPVKDVDMVRSLAEWFARNQLKSSRHKKVGRLPAPTILVLALWWSLPVVSSVLDYHAAGFFIVLANWVAARPSQDLVSPVTLAISGVQAKKRAASCFFSSNVNLSSNCVRQDKPKLQPPLIGGPIFGPIFGLVLVCFLVSFADVCVLSSIAGKMDLVVSLRRLATKLPINLIPVGEVKLCFSLFAKAKTSLRPHLGLC
uniref:Cathepsin propeptide inhibitor domain-containing protein n=1 Tax=Oryza meridionalis TaxID=40149 RepID=A0A0E0E6W3_9ORYZ